MNSFTGAGPHYYTFTAAFKVIWFHNAGHQRIVGGPTNIKHDSSAVVYSEGQFVKLLK